MVIKFFMISWGNIFETFLDQFVFTKQNFAFQKQIYCFDYLTSRIMTNNTIMPDLL